MKKLVLISAVLISTVACAGAALASDEFHDLYLAKCKKCHGGAGEGSKVMEKMLKVEIKPICHADVQGKSDEVLKKDVLEGVGKMKPAKEVSPEQADGLVAHLRTMCK